MAIAVNNVNKGFLINPVIFTGASFNTSIDVLRYIPVGFSSTASTNDIPNVDLLSNNNVASGILGFLDAKDTPKVYDGITPQPAADSEYLIEAGTYVRQNYPYNVYPSGQFTAYIGATVTTGQALTIKTTTGTGQGWGFIPAASGTRIYARALAGGSAGNLIPILFNYQIVYNAFA